MRPLINAQSEGWCYLLHLARPLGNLANARAQAQHYVGFALNLDERIAEHLAGEGAKITRAAVAQGIAIELVACWRAPLAFEKQIKRRKEAPRLCPICCAKHGRKVKQAVFVEQLALPFDEPTGDFPAVPQLRPDWIEIATLRRWRARPSLELAGNWDEGLL